MDKCSHKGRKDAPFMPCWTLQDCCLIKLSQFNPQSKYPVEIVTAVSHWHLYSNTNLFLLPSPVGLALVTPSVAFRCDVQGWAEEKNPNKIKLQSSAWIWDSHYKSSHFEPSAWLEMKLICTFGLDDNIGLIEKLHSEGTAIHVQCFMCH